MFSELSPPLTRSRRLGPVVVASLLLLSVLAVLQVAVPAAHAQTIYSITTTNGSTACTTIANALSGPPASGAWSGTTCTIHGAITVSSGTTLDVGAGVAVTVSSGSGDGIFNSGIINNDGTMTGSASRGGAGIDNSGTINNYGILMADGGTGANGADGSSDGGAGAAGGIGGVGIINFGTINNNGNMIANGGTGGAGGAGGSSSGGEGGNGGNGGPGGSGINSGGTINNAGSVTGSGGAGGVGGTGGSSGGAGDSTGGTGGSGGAGIVFGGTINNDGNMIANGGIGGFGGAGSSTGGAPGTAGSSGEGIANGGMINDYCGVTLSYTSPSSLGIVNAVHCQTVIFAQSGLPSGAEWHITASWGPFVLPENHTGFSSSISVSLVGLLSYTFGSPVTISGVSYQCVSGCSATNVPVSSDTTTFSAVYGLNPQQATLSLANTVNGMNLPRGITTSLDSKLSATVDSLNAGNNRTAANQLNAFIHEVNAQTGKTITTTQALELVSDAQAIIAAISS